MLKVIFKSLRVQMTMKQKKKKKNRSGIVKFEALRLIKLVAARCRRKRKLGENMALC